MTHYIVFVKVTRYNIKISPFISLHREALKQSATDPLSGKIDVGILTTGLSTAARKKRADLVASIRENLKKKGGIPTVPWQKLFSEIKEASQIVSSFLIYNCKL